jgi:hypothetical protein
MSYKQIMNEISTYRKVDHQWMTECLNIARMQGLEFDSMNEFFDWACCESGDSAF